MFILSLVALFPLNLCAPVSVICNNGQVVEAPKAHEKLSSDIRNFWSALNPANELGADYGSILSKFACWQGLEGDATQRDTLNVTTEQVPGDISNEFPNELNINLKSGISGQLFQSDIVLVKDQADQLEAIMGASSPFQRKVFPEFEGISRKWEMPIQYSFDNSLSDTTIQKIESAIGFWQDNTCVSFVRTFSPFNPSQGQVPDQITFFKGGGCFATVGKAGGFQGISIGEGCEHFGIITHEIGHTLGFFHEQSRDDRDDFITVDFTNIFFSSFRQYSKIPKELLDYFGASYDLGSVMHYPATGGFAVDPSIPVISSNQHNHQFTMGNRLKPSFIDVLQMNRFYSCLDVCNTSTIECQNNGYNDPKQACNACVCPEGFAGKYCQRSPATGYSPSETLEASENWHTLDFHFDLPEGSLINRRYWHIISPPNTLIEIELDPMSMYGHCSEGCNRGYVEIKLGSGDSGVEFQGTGFRFCCSNRNIEAMVSHSNRVPVMAYFPQKFAFALQYRYSRHITALFISSLMHNYFNGVVLPVPEDAGGSGEEMFEEPETVSLKENAESEEDASVPWNEAEDYLAA